MAVHSECGPIDSSDKLMDLSWRNVSASLLKSSQQVFAELKIANVLLHSHYYKLALGHSKSVLLRGSQVAVN